jgi:hypothetical protein
MADETCVEVNCCPLGYSVPGLGGTLSLAGDDSTSTDPNIADGELVLAEEGAWVATSFATPSTDVLNVVTLALPPPPQTFSDFSNVKVGYYAYCVAIYRTTQIVTLGSADVVVGSLSGLATGMILEFATDYFPYGTTIQNIAGSGPFTLTLSNNALASSLAVDFLYRPTTGPVKVGGLPLIPTGTRVASVAGDFSSVTLDTATLTVSLIPRSIVAFYPAELDANVFDEAQLFT